MQEYGKNHVVVPLLWASQQDGALVADILSLKNYRQADIYVMLGATVGQAGAITLQKGTSVSSAATTMAFTRYYETGIKLKYTTPSVDTPAAADETVSGAGGAAATLYRDTGTELIMYGFDNDTFVDGETVTLSGGKTVVADGIQINGDILIPRTATSNTFNVNAAGYKLYMIPVSAEDLGDGYDCVELNVADLNTTDLAAWAVLSGPRYLAEIPETAIYD